MPKTASAVRTYRFDQMARMINDRVDDPAESGVERYVGLEHLDADSLRIRRWGDITDVESTKLRFKPGDIVFGKRRVYQRKLAVADFEGICSAHAMVLRARPDVVLPEFLPFFMQSDLFMERALAISVGSLSPTINWTDLAAQEFALPPIEEQRRALSVLTATAIVDVSLWNARDRASKLLTAMQHELAGQSAEWDRIAISDLCSSDAPLCYGVVQPGDNDPSGVPLLRVCDIEASTIRPAELKRVTPQLDASYRRSRVAAGDVLVSVVGTIGRVFVVSAAEAGFNIARAIARIRTDKCEPHYLALYLRSPQVQRELTGESFETARKTLNLEALGQIEVPVPPRTIQAQWCRRLSDVQNALTALNVRCDAVQRVRRSIVEPIFSEGGS